MKYLDCTLPEPAANLARDEALLDSCEEGAGGEVLCFWEASRLCVVTGYANCLAREVDLPRCQQLNVPVLRRCSGGGAVVQGPGCLSYSLVLRLERAAALASIPATNRWIMERHRQALSELLHLPVQVRGHTDLAIEDRKFSGNAQRRKRQAVLFHGTFLLTFDLESVDRCLRHPSHEPAYRRQRPHAGFLRNIPLTSEALKARLRELWNAEEPLTDWPEGLTQELVARKYARDEWNQRS